jgi:hypothetical protein
MPPRFAYWTIILDGIATSFRAREREEILPLFNQQKKKDPTAQLKWFSGGKLWDSPEAAKEERLLERDREFRNQRDERDREGREFRARQGDRRGFGDRPMGPRPDRPQGPPSDRAPWKGDRPRGPQSDRDRSPWKSDRPTGPRPDRPQGPPPDRDRAPWKGGDSAPPADRPKEPRRSKDWRPGGEHKDPRDKYKLPPGEARKRWKQRHLGPKPSGPRPTGPPSTSLRPGRPGRPFGDKPAGPPRSPGFKPAGPGRKRSK